MDQGSKKMLLQAIIMPAHIVIGKSTTIIVMAFAENVVAPANARNVAEMATNDLHDAPTLGTFHWIVVTLFALSPLCGFGYGIINIMLTGSVSSTLLWFLPLSSVVALLAWVYARKVSRLIRWAPLVLVGYIMTMLFCLPTKVQRMTWTGLVTECRYETYYMMKYDMMTPDGSTTRHYLQAGVHYLANETPFPMVSYEVLYGKDDGRELECKRFEPYSIDIGEGSSEEAPTYNIPDNYDVRSHFYRGKVKRETLVEKYLWFERGKEHITLQGLFPFSTLTIARSSYTPDVVVEDVAGNIMQGSSFEERVNGKKQKDVIDTYCKALGIQADS